MHAASAEQEFYRPFSSSLMVLLRTLLRKPSGSVRQQTSGHPLKPPSVNGQGAQQVPGADYRYIVLEVDRNEAETRAKLISLDGERVVVAHLRDGWADASVEAGDSVNLLSAAERGEDGGLSVVCDYQAGEPAALLTLGVG